MPRTLENHLVGVTADAPHPDGYRPDLPLRSELADTDIDAGSYDTGYDEGFDDATTRHGSRIYSLERQLAEERATTRALSAQLAQQGERAS